MIPAPFAYARPRTARELTDLLAGSGPDVALLAGGQSLLSDLKLRRRTPELVVDLAGVAGLDAVSAGPDAVVFGAMARQSAIVADPEVNRRLPLLAEVASAAADPMVRRRGTLVGACCEVAPGGDWLAAALAMDGTVVLEGANGTREAPLTEFVLGPAAPDIRAGEYVRSVRLPVPGPRTAVAYRKVKHASVGWSVAGAAIVLTADEDGEVVKARVAVSGAPTFPCRLPELETALCQGDLLDSAQLDEVIDAALAKLDYQGDYFASASYRRTRLAVLLRRTLLELTGTGDHGSGVPGSRHASHAVRLRRG